MSATTCNGSLQAIRYSLDITEIGYCCDSAETQRNLVGTKTIGCALRCAFLARNYRIYRMFYLKVQPKVLVRPSIFQYVEGDVKKAIGSV